GVTNAPIEDGNCNCSLQISKEKVSLRMEEFFGRNGRGKYGLESYGPRKNVAKCKRNIMTPGRNDPKIFGHFSMGPHFPILSRVKSFWSILN
ncbi:Hypothetical protein FKW44_025276, partial [Caligus rogercresseyi]